MGETLMSASGESRPGPGETFKLMSASGESRPPGPALTVRSLLPKRVADIILLFTYLVSAFVACFVVWQLVEKRAERHVIAISTAGFAVAIALPLSVWDVNKHVQHFVSPLQRHYIRIILMVPIYAVESWLALTFKDQRIYLEVLREAYEAWVIYSIQRLFCEFLGGKDGVEDRLKLRAAAANSERAHFLPPFGALQGWRLRNDFQYYCNVLNFQYVFLRVVFAVASLFAESAGTLCAGSTDFAHCLYPWSTLILSASQFGAMYALVLFYHQLDTELAPLKALSKVLIVKAVVFFSFWQGTIIGFLEFEGAFRATEFYSPEEITSGLQNFLVCWEMAAAAAAHHFLFDYREVLRLAESHAGTMPVFEGGRAAPATAVIMLLPHDAIAEGRDHLVAAAGVPHMLGQQTVRALRSAAGVSMSPARDGETQPLV
jgi:hypothetical protein